jgi:aryl carrier-like protein
MNPTTAPQTADIVTDEVVAWLQEKLEDKEITGTDNFLEVGGHSMLAIELNASLVERHGTDLDLAQLFKNPIQEAVAQAFGSSAA